MQVVILCGGLGTRLKEETEFRPKPMVRIGTRPILWHIMKIYSAFGHHDFILALGYKGEMIKEYFYHYELMDSDVTIRLGNPEKICVFTTASRKTNGRSRLQNTGKSPSRGQGSKKWKNILSATNS